jgi:hypothetical protein
MQQTATFSDLEQAMTTRYRALLTALFASLVLSQAPAQADGLADIVSRGILKVAVPQDFPPFGSVGPDMQPRGLDIDTAKLIADQLKVKLQLTPVNSTNRIPFLTTGKVDLVISSLGKNPEREQVIDFSKAYAPFYLAVFGPPDAAISNLDDLKGKTISVTRGAIEDIELSKVAPAEATIKRFEDNNSTIASRSSSRTPRCTWASTRTKRRCWAGSTRSSPPPRPMAAWKRMPRPGSSNHCPPTSDHSGFPWPISSISTRSCRTATCCSRARCSPWS